MFLSQKEKQNHKKATAGKLGIENCTGSTIIVRSRKVPQPKIQYSKHSQPLNVNEQLSNSAYEMPIKFHFKTFSTC